MFSSRLFFIRTCAANGRLWKRLFGTYTYTDADTHARTCDTG